MLCRLRYTPGAKESTMGRQGQRRSKYKEGRGRLHTNGENNEKLNFDLSVNSKKNVIMRGYEPL